MTIETSNEVVQEFRAVCAAFGTPGHHEHAYQKDTFELAARYGRKMDTTTPGPESPFTVQTRLITDWEPAVETEDESEEGEDEVSVETS